MREVGNGFRSTWEEGGGTVFHGKKAPSNLAALPKIHREKSPSEGMKKTVHRIWHALGGKRKKNGEGRVFFQEGGSVWKRKLPVSRKKEGSKSPAVGGNKRKKTERGSKLQKRGTREDILGEGRKRKMAKRRDKKIHQNLKGTQNICHNKEKGEKKAFSSKKKLLRARGGGGGELTKLERGWGWLSGAGKKKRKSLKKGEKGGTNIRDISGTENTRLGKNRKHPDGKKKRERSRNSFQLKGDWRSLADWRGEERRGGGP